MERSIFLRFYPNLPINIRRDIVLDIEELGGPISWEVAYREIQADTERGKKILKKLIDLSFIPSTDEELQNFLGKIKND